MGDPELGTADTLLGDDVAAPPGGWSRSKLRPGDAVGAYVVESFCGAGGMGVVYRGRDRLLGREVAIKLVGSERSGSNRCGLLCSLLVREAQVMAKLSHPGLVGVYGVGELDGCVYVAMEYVEGVTLREWARERGWRERLWALSAAGRALAAAHASGVFHRDFKPDNVMITREGAVKVMDFGLARGPGELESPSGVGACASCAPPAEVARVVDVGAPVGTPRYMAPEGEVPAGVAVELARALRASPSRRFPSLGDLLDRLEQAAL